MPAYSSVYVTAPDLETAKRIAREVVERRLAACANIFPVTSVYRWEGSIQEDQEVGMFLKTTREKVPELAAAVAEAHPYAVPCAVGFELGEGHRPYYDWVSAETTGTSSSS